MRKVKASTTVEMAYIMPVVFLIFIAVTYILFYLHDKNILIGAAHETLVAGNQKLRWDEEDAERRLEELFQERIEGKLIFFPKAEAEITSDGKELVLSVYAKKGSMSIRTEQRAEKNMPEHFIRNRRRLDGDKIQERIK